MTIPFDQAYQQLLDDSDFVRYIRRIPSFFQYDDHEIANNFDGQQREKQPELFHEGLTKYRNYFASRNPNSYGNDSYYYGFDFGNVAFFVVDTRTHRSANLVPDGPNKTLLGSEQIQRLKAWLLKKQQEKFVFKFLASPSLWLKFQKQASNHITQTVLHFFRTKGTKF